MPRKKKPTNQALVTTKSVAGVQALPKEKRRNGLPVTSSTRAIFLKAYELSFGNISESCRAAGITRGTFYRWANSPTRVNERFRERLDKLKPHEARIDFLEAAHTALVKRGDTAAVIFGLKTQGRNRGWSERPETILLQVNLLENVAQAYQAWLGDHPNAAIEEKMRWLGRFADQGKVPPAELAKKVGVSLNGE